MENTLLKNTLYAFCFTLYGRATRDWKSESVTNGRTYGHGLVLETLVCLKSNKYVYSCVVTKFGPEPMVDILDPSIFSFFKFVCNLQNIIQFRSQECSKLLLSAMRTLARYNLPFHHFTISPFHQHQPIDTFLVR